MAGIAGLWNENPESCFEIDLSRAAPVLGGGAGGLVEYVSDGALTLVHAPEANRALKENDKYGLVDAAAPEVVVAIGRVDNWAEIVVALGLSHDERRCLSDPELLARCWLRWGLDCFKHVIADCSLVVWTRDSRRLTLLRSPMSSIGLYWQRIGSSLLFATELEAILAARRQSPQPDLDTLLELYSNNEAFVAQRTPFAGVNAILNGRALRFDAADMPQEYRLWEPGRKGTSCKDLADAGAVLRDIFDTAVEARLRRPAGRVASELSSGRDSSAVTASAAALLARRGERLISLTGVPVADYLEHHSEEVRGDEGPLAATTAGHYQNIEHVLCGPRKAGLINDLDFFHRAAAAPMRGLNNLPWQLALLAKARERGVSVLLRGGHGNWSISAGGQMMFTDVLRESGTWKAFGTGAHYARTDLRLWWNVIHFLLGPRLPKRAYALLFRLRGHSLRAQQAPFLNPPHRSRVQAIRQGQQEDPRPVRSYRDLIRVYFADRADNENFFAKTVRGIEMRDPTSDPRLIDHILAQPAHFFVSAKDRRPLYEAAFRDRIPPEVLYAKPIGMPGEDWNLVYQPAELDRAFQAYGTNPLVREIVDIDAARNALKRWPKGNPSLDDYTLYVQELLNSLSLASFIHVRFPN